MFHVVCYTSNRFEKNQKGVTDFDRAVRNMRSKDDAKSANLVEKFEKAKRVIVGELISSSSVTCFWEVFLVVLSLLI